MNASEAIADSLRRTLTGPMWHGAAVNQLLSGLSAADAACRPIAGAHTIWELVLHMAAWASVVEHGAYHGGQIAVLKRALRT